MNFSTISRICHSMSAGWSPTGIFVNPGRSTNVKLSASGEYIRSPMAEAERATPVPHTLAVSSSISCLTYETRTGSTPLGRNDRSGARACADDCV